MKNFEKLLPAFFTWLCLLLIPVDAIAIIGMPLTPMSYAGVARRTVRRTTYATAAYAGATTAAVATVPMTALPPGCAVGVPCAGATYQPAYSGGTVVYVNQ